MKRALPLLVIVLPIIFLCVQFAIINVSDSQIETQVELNYSDFGKNLYDKSNVINFDISKVSADVEFSFVHNTCVCTGHREEKCDTEAYNPDFSIVNINDDIVSHFTQKITIKGYNHIHYLDLLSNREIICIVLDENGNDVFLVIKNGKIDKSIPLKILPDDMKAYNDSVLLFYENQDPVLASYSAYLFDTQSGEQKKILSDIGDIDRLRVRSNKILYHSVENDGWVVYENGNKTIIDFKGDCMDFLDNENLVCYRKHKLSWNFRKITGSFYKCNLETGRSEKMFSCATDETKPTRFILSNSGNWAIFSVGGENIADSYLLNFDDKELLKLKYEYLYPKEPIYR